MPMKWPLFWQLFFLSLAAAYLPAVVWMFALPGIDDNALLLVAYSPILATALLAASTMMGATIMLVVFLGLVACLSWRLRESTIGWKGLPLALFVVSLCQGWCFGNLGGLQ